MNISETTISYLALGDSYTVGEAVEKNESWPVQLTNRIKSLGLNIKSPRILAKTGWTTTELISAISSLSIEPSYKLVSLLIGVNNQYKGYDISIYVREFDELLDHAIKLAGNNHKYVFVLSIPDYSVTAFVKNKNLDPLKITKEIQSYNEIALRIANSKMVNYFDVTTLSRKAVDNSWLIANDKLHPSGLMYTSWVDVCFEWVVKTLRK